VAALLGGAGGFLEGDDAHGATLAPLRPAA
jgi:hypothetical protein